MPVLLVLRREIFLASLKTLATGEIIYHNAICAKNAISAVHTHNNDIYTNNQEAVDGHIDLNNLYWERSAPGDQRPPIYLLLPTSSTPYTHKVRYKIEENIL